MSRIRRGTCAEPGPYGCHCTDYPGHRFSHHDAGEDESWTGRDDDDEPSHGCDDSDCGEQP